MSAIDALPLGSDGSCGWSTPRSSPSESCRGPRDGRDRRDGSRHRHPGLAEHPRLSSGSPDCTHGRTSGRPALKAEQWGIWLEAVRRFGVALYLVAIAFGLASIIRVLRFQAIRVNELPDQERVLGPSA